MENLPVVDAVVLTAGTWLKTALEHTRAEGVADTTVLVYRMVSKFPMTAAQYWQVANAGTAVMPSSAYLEPWMSAQVWMSLSDWDGAGDGLHRLAEAATTFWAKGLAATADLDHMKAVLQKRMAVMSTRVTWSAPAFKKWLANPENELAQWTAEGIRALPTATHTHLLDSYLHRGGEHTSFELEAVRLLLESKRVGQVQKSIAAYMERKSTNALSAQTLLVMGAWLETLKWTPSNAKGTVSKLCVFLRCEPMPVWENFFPCIGASLAYLADHPDALDRLVIILASAPYTQIGQPRLLARIFAAVNAKLPERFVLKAIENGGLLSALENKNYPVQQRLTWLKTHEDYALHAGNVMAHMARLEPPIRDALALLCFLSARKGVTADPTWRAAGLVESVVFQEEFLQVNAPSLLEKIDIVLALDLSYADAVDMLLGDGRAQATMLALPELSAAFTLSSE